MNEAKLDLPDGYYALPLEQVANVATFLDMREPPARPLHALATPYRLQRVDAGDLATYRALFRRIGADLMWFSRLFMPDTELAAILGHPQVDSFLLMGPEPLGLLELDFREPAGCELSFIGLVPEATGKGLGKALLDTAIARAFAARPDTAPVSRLWVHTCTFDSPAALPNYLRAGFVPYARKLELHRDPRQTGHLPRTAAPHVPLIEPRQT